MRIAFRVWIALLLALALAAEIASLRQAKGALLEARIAEGSSGDGTERLALEAARLDPTSWRAQMDVATALAREGKLDSALGLLVHVRRVRIPIDGLFLEAAIHAETGPRERAIEEFLRLARISPLDRVVVQNLIRLESFGAPRPEFSRIVRDAERLWPGSFDILVARGNLAAAIDQDAVTSARELLLAMATLEGRAAEGLARPAPEVFGEPAVRRQLDALMEHLGPANAFSRLRR